VRPSPAGPAVSIVEELERGHRTVVATISAMLVLNLAATATGVLELDTVGSALGAVADDLSSAGSLAAAREQRLTLLASRLAVVVRMAREVSGSLSVRHVSGPPPRPPRTSSARPYADAESRAYPLVLAGALVGVLHVDVPRADEDAERVLEALLSTAATALESARLNRVARERADIDPVTELPNRWRLDADLEAEWERCTRDDRPVTFVMIDLDRFKLLNDRYGHPLGDAALRAAAAAITAGLRISDTAYRYGGEEFAVLLRETDLAAGIGLAERLRAGVAAVHVPGSDVIVTASLGVAGRRWASPNGPRT
jgi:diguanylate cyclase (GGDEF)-like protein